MIYLLVGYSGSGKTTVASFLKEQGFDIFEASDHFKKIRDELDLETPQQVYNSKSKDIVSKSIASKIRGNTPVAISGLRTKEEVNYFKSNYDCKTIWIYAELNKAYERCRERNRSDMPPSFQEFLQTKILGDLSLGLGYVLENYVDEFINNSEEFPESELVRLLRKWTST